MTQGRDDPDRRFLPWIDADFSFVSKNIGQLHDYWRTKLNGRQMPVRADIDPIDIPKLLPYVALIKVGHRVRHLYSRCVFGWVGSYLDMRTHIGSSTMGV